MWSNITSNINKSKLCLSKDKFNKWIKKPEIKYNDPPKGIGCCLELYDLVHIELEVEATIWVSGLVSKT